MKAVGTIGQETREADLFNKQFAQLSRTLSANPLINGVLVTNISSVNGTFTPGHSLGRSYKGFIIVRRDANVAIWDTARGPLDARVLYLQANGVCTFDAWVF